MVVLSLLTVFFVSAPMILLYASGYSYSLKKNRLEKSGILNVSSVPTGATVTLDGRPLRRVTPVSVGHLLPDQYPISVSKPGYMTWSKSLTVNSGKTTFIKEIVLVPESLPQLIAASSSAGVFDSTGSTAAFFVEDGDWLEMTGLNLAAGSSLPLGRLFAETYRDAELSLSPDGQLLLLSLRQGDETLRRIFTTAPAESGSQELTTGPISAEFASWANGGASLALVSGSRLEVRGGDGVVVQRELETEVTGLLYGRDAIWMTTVSADGMPSLIRVRPSDLQPVGSPIPLPRTGLTPIGGNDRLLVLSGDEPDSGLLVDTDAEKSFRLPKADGLSWENQNRSGRLLLWNEFEIHIVDAETGESRLVTRLGASITGCVWHPLGTMAIYATDREIMAVELDDRDRRNSFRLADFDSVGLMAVDRPTSSLRFFGAVGNRRGIYERPL
ncbi:MAG: PEGA domain-containing protein [bacterium]